MELQSEVFLMESTFLILIDLRFTANRFEACEEEKTFKALTPVDLR